MSTTFPRLLIASSALLACCAAPPKQTPHHWSASGGAFGSPVLGELITYRAHLKHAMRAARRQFLASGYSLTRETETELAFQRPLGESTIALDIAFTPNESALVHRWHANLRVLRGPAPAEDLMRELLDEATAILRPLGPESLPYIRD